MSYSSLHTHSTHSALDGYGTARENLQMASKLGLNALAVTEHGNVSSFFDYDIASKDFPDVKVIMGVEFYESPTNNPLDQDKENKYFHLICLARNEQGRKDLNMLVTRSNFENFYFKPRVCLDWFKDFNTDNFIITTACMASRLSREYNFNKCVSYISEYKKLFPYFYLEMQSHHSEEQAEYNRKILKLSQVTNTPFVITCDVHYPSKEDAKYQSYLVGIGRNSTGYDKNSLENGEIYEGCYFQTEEEIHECMDKQIGYENVCKGLENSNVISDMCEQGHMPFPEKPSLPNYPLPPQFKTNYDYLVYLCELGWKDRNFDTLNEKDTQTYKERLKHELSVIHDMEFDGYFLIVWDFLNWCRTHGVEINTGRGSACGSLVCYLTHITDIDPIKYNLLFARFLGKHRHDYPDVDSDVADRDKVIKYLGEKYGYDNVAQIINFNYITPTTAITDIGKVLGFNYNDMKKLSQKFTSDKWDECIALNPTLLNDYPQYTELFDIVSHLCSSPRIRNFSVHAGGVVISNDNINNYTALRRGTNGERVLQCDKRNVETGLGLVKFDILGLATLNLFAEIKKDLNIDPWELDISNPNFENDKASYELLSSGKTLGLFQLSSAGMKDLATRLRPKNIEELCAIVSLYRPDSMGALEDYVDRAINGTKPVYIHPDMGEVLDVTYGACLYQEEIMGIAVKFGGYTLEESDLFRKAIGKKNRELVKSESEKLRKRIIENGYSEEVANYIADDMSSKGGYCFNKSHGLAYSVTALRSAYLKTHYPVYFFKALFNLDKNKAGAINKYILESKDFNVQVLPPNVNHSEMNFSVSNDKIIFGLSAITGIGESVAQQIIDERNANGLFKSFDDFKERTNLKKSQIIALIKAGAIPCKNKMVFLKKYLESLYEPLEFSEVASIPTYNKLIIDWGIDISKYELETTGKRKSYDKDALLVEYNRLKKIKFDEEQKVRFSKFIEENKKYIEDEEFWEFQTLQIFINNNPFESAFDLMSQTFDEVEVGDECVIVGIISKVQKKKDKNGKQFAYANIYSTFGLVEALVWHSQLKEYEDLVKKGEKVAILCRKDSDTNVTTKKMKPYEQWLEDMVKIKNN